ncbi:hypothetical protein PoB_002842700 [Plakobranchus ocellatus]|uniref:Uncharacterized protein n=1 Tax=Plakobranchus ocellatus TaxID=259542 RepID=A0AAV4A4V0_9GAST|nr:hypothetical protein PoB_002842700 [Plakobranchus ocellatus]
MGSGGAPTPFFPLPPGGKDLIYVRNDGGPSQLPDLDQIGLSLATVDVFWAPLTFRGSAGFPEVPGLKLLDEVLDSRLEWVADTWDQAKAEILHERHEILNRKLVLQHALVRAQDRRAELRRHSEHEAEEKVRAEQKSTSGINYGPCFSATK